MSELSRRTIVAGAAALPALAVPALAASAAVVAPAAISEAPVAFDRAAEVARAQHIVDVLSDLTSAKAGTSHSTATAPLSLSRMSGVTMRLTARVSTSGQGLNG